MKEREVSDLLHDRVLQNLFFVQIATQSQQESLTEKMPVAIQEAIQVLQEILKGQHYYLRNASLSLVFAQLGAVYQAHAAIEFEMIAPLAHPNQENAGLVVYRWVDNQIQNALLAAATKIKVEFNNQDDRIIIAVRDNRKIQSDSQQNRTEPNLIGLLSGAKAENERGAGSWQINTLSFPVQV